MDTTKTNVTMKVIRTTVRRTTASSQQLERHAQQAVHNAQQVHQWRRWLLRLRGAHRALSLHIERTVPHLMMTMHNSWLKFWAITLSSPCHPWRVLFDSISLFFLTGPSCPSPSSSSIPSCSLSSTTRLSWQVCTSPPQMRVRTPWTPSPLNQVVSQTSWLSASSTTYQSPSLSWSLPRTKTWMTWLSARCSQRHTEDKSKTAYQEACQSVSRRRQ